MSRKISEERQAVLSAEEIERLRVMLYKDWESVKKDAMASFQARCKAAKEATSTKEALRNRVMAAMDTRPGRRRHLSLPKS